MRRIARTALDGVGAGRVGRRSRWGWASLAARTAADGKWVGRIARTAADGVGAREWLDPDRPIVWIKGFKPVVQTIVLNFFFNEYRSIFLLDLYFFFLPSSLWPFFVL